MTLRWSDYEDGTFYITQRKTGTKVAAPVSHEMHAVLNSMSRSAIQAVVAEGTGHPYKSSYFSHEFARIRSLAGLPDYLQAPDFRRTAATELGQAGATDDEIRAVTGHKSRGIVAVYVRPDAGMGKAGQAKRSARRRTKT